MLCPLQSFKSSVTDKNDYDVAEFNRLRLVSDKLLKFLRSEFHVVFTVCFGANC